MNTIYIYSFNFLLLKSSAPAMSCLEMMQNVRNLAPITFHDSYLGVMGLLSWLDHYGSGTPNQSAETMFLEMFYCVLYLIVKVS